MPLINTSGRLFGDWEKNQPSISRTGAQHPGVVVHGLVTGFFCWLFGIDEQCNIDGKVVYVNRKSLQNFLERVHVVDMSTNDLSSKSIHLIVKTLCSKIAENEWIEPTQLPSAILDESHASISSLIKEFSERKWANQISILGGKWTVSGYTSTKEQHEADRERLLMIMRAHNAEMASRIPDLGKDDAGYIEKLNIQNGATVFVRADLHSDLNSLMAQLKLLQQEGFLDSEYRCVPPFHMIFVGDYMDRGVNDVEVMTLLSLLRLRNPSSVHLLRGNHEDVDLQQKYSTEARWLAEHRDLFTSLYKTMPLALCVGEQKGVPEKKGQRQYVHFSHALFSIGVNLNPLLRGKQTNLVVRKGKSYLEEVAPEANEKVKQAQNKLAAISNEARTAAGYMYSDVGVVTKRSKRKAGHVLAPKDIHAYAQLCSSDEAALKAFVRGHEHELRQETVARKRGGEKVIVSTLAVGIGEGTYAQQFSDQKQQGLLLKVAPRVSNWKKTAVICHGKGKTLQFSLSGHWVGMYDLVNGS